MWQEAIDAIVQAPPGAPVGQVALAINRTPCSFCADHVAEALAIVVRDLRAANIVAPVFVLAATGTYEPLIDASQEEIDADRALYTAWAHARGLTTKAEVDRYLERRVLVTRLDRLAATKWEDSKTWWWPAGISEPCRLPLKSLSGRSLLMLRASWRWSSGQPDRDLYWGSDAAAAACRLSNTRRTK